MNKNNNKMDLLGNAPVPQALMALGIPIMIGMLINALYNLVDAYFIGGLGESQMGAISIAFPLGQVVVGLGLMFGNGAASYLSRLLGRGDREAASKVASTALYSSVCIGAVIIIGTAIFLKPILTMLGATDTIMPYALYCSGSPLSGCRLLLKAVLSTEFRRMVWFQWQTQVFHWPAIYDPEFRQLPDIHHCACP